MIEKRPLIKSKVVRRAIKVFCRAYWIEKRPLRKSKVVRRAINIFVGPTGLKRGLSGSLKWSGEPF